MSVIYRPRPHPYIPNALNAAQIQTAEDENNVPAIFKRHPYVRVQPASRSYIPNALNAAQIQTAEDENNVPAIFGRRALLFNPVIRTRANMDFPYPGGEDILPPFIVNKTFRPAQGRGPKTKIMLMRIGVRKAPATR